ncbi:Pseudouridylate synthase RPUSD4, mitochondrial [Anthophora retusa]
MAKKSIHPFKQIHPWRSEKEFADDLLNNIIYDKDGLVVLNKPYGIPRGKGSSEFNRTNSVSHSVHYTLEDALPHIRSQLKYPQLTISKCPEKYISGVTLLAADTDILNAIDVAYVRSYHFGNTYWVITVGVPTIQENNYRLALKIISDPQYKNRKTILTRSWTSNEEKYRRVKIFKARYEIISNSTFNLCSLLKLRASTENSAPGLPNLDEKLLQLLEVHLKQQEIIPAHIHLQSTMLPSLFGEDVFLQAPLPPFFNWTCKQLEFKHLMQNDVPCEERI